MSTEIAEERMDVEEEKKERAKFEGTLPGAKAIREKITALKKLRDERLKTIDETTKEDCNQVDESHKAFVKAEKEELREKARIEKQSIKESCDKAVAKWESVIEAQIEVAKREKEAELRAEAEKAEAAEKAKETDSKRSKTKK